MIVGMFGIVVAAMPVSMLAQQRMQEREQEFQRLAPLIGEPLPDVTVYASDGSPFRTSDLKGHFTVLTFGCLTCPPSIWNIAGLEAVQRDYGPKGVQFYFIFKSLAHPELAGDYIQPFTLEERLLLARRAKSQFGTQIPWIVDAMDNRLKHALGDRPNSQFLINPDGIVVRKRAWANFAEVRKDLEELVGPVDHVTREEDVVLPGEKRTSLPTTPPAGPRIPRPNMLPIVLEPVQEAEGRPFFAKLRAEADARLLAEGSGKLYLGFHLDPLYDRHWARGGDVLSWQIAVSPSLQLQPLEAKANAATRTSDTSPREFLLDVTSWPVDQPLRLVVKYQVCDGDQACECLEQSYVLRRERDADGGGARGAGAGYWEPAEFVKQLLRGDANRDGQLSKSEAVGLVVPHFEALDTNHNGLLDREELKTVAEWLNHRHLPGPAVSTPKP